MCEQTARRAAAIVSLSGKDSDSAICSPSDFLGLVRDIKVMLKLCWKGYVESPLDIDEYPADPFNLTAVSHMNLEYFLAALRCL